MYIRTNRQGETVKRSYCGDREIYEDIKHKKIEGRSLHPTVIERTEDYGKDLNKRSRHSMNFDSCRQNNVGVGKRGIHTI